MSTLDVTTLLARWSSGDAGALEQLTPIVYDELRRIARRHLARERKDHTLQSTQKIVLEDQPEASAPAENVAEVLALHEALERLAAFDQQQARIVELRYFAGLSIEETAEVIGVSPATVKRDWVMARAWLARELKGGSSG